VGEAVHDDVTRDEALGEMAAREAGDASDKHAAGHDSEEYAKGGPDQFATTTALTLESFGRLARLRA